MYVGFILLVLVGILMVSITKTIYKMTELPTDSENKPIDLYIWGIRILGILFLIAGIGYIVLHIMGYPINYVFN